MVEKAARYGADAVILDLEDGVAPDAKVRARQVVAAALERGFPEGLPVFVRVNGVESGLLEADLSAAFRPRVDALCVPKCDTAGLEADTRSARALGYTGKMLIHPAQIAPVHAVFAPSPAEVDHARRVVAAFEEAQARGEGIAVVDGAMVDRPVVLRAARILAIADRR